MFPQTKERACKYVRGPNMASKAPVRLRVSPRHWREDDCDWSNVRTGADEHDHNRMYDDVLQVNIH